MRERADVVRDGAGFETPDIHSSSAAYAGRFSGAVGQWLLQVQNEATLRLLPTNVTRILDAGGGHGQNLAVLKSTQAHVSVLGSDSSCCALISAALEEGMIDFVVGPLTKLPFPDQYFDLSLSYRMLTHLVDWPVHIAELCRVTRAAVLVEFPVRKGFNAFSSQLFGLKKNIEKNTRPFTLFEETDVIQNFEQQGFALTARQAQFFWPMALHRLHGIVFIARLFEWLPRISGLTHLVGSPVIARFERRTD